ncbi:hypothetical protein RHMOL_RhmolMtG0004300 (mitochondrion) [Rhododendron molle]|nr:hypothetical protein RHMOL_RhmolMtG0004300 [Rhododendron molle]
MLTLKSRVPFQRKSASVASNTCSSSCSKPVTKSFAKEKPVRCRKFSNVAASLNSRLGSDLQPVSWERRDWIVKDVPRGVPCPILTSSAGFLFMLIVLSFPRERISSFIRLSDLLLSLLPKLWTSFYSQKPRFWHFNGSYTRLGGTIRLRQRKSNRSPASFLDKERKAGSYPWQYCLRVYDRILREVKLPVVEGIELQAVGTEVCLFPSWESTPLVTMISLYSLLFHLLAPESLAALSPYERQRPIQRRKGTEDRGGVGAVLVSPPGAHIPIAVKLKFDCSNNVAEYEPCVTGLQAAVDMAKSWMCLEILHWS